MCVIVKLALTLLPASIIHRRMGLFGVSYNQLELLGARNLIFFKIWHIIIITFLLLLTCNYNAKWLFFHYIFVLKAQPLKQMYKDLLDEKFEPDLIEYDLPLSVCRILFVCSSIRTLLIMSLSQLYQLVDISMCRQHSTLSTGAGTARSSTAHSRLVYRTVQ